MNNNVSRSCPPGPWLPAASASGASGSRECHQLVSGDRPAAGQSSGDQPGPASSMTSSFSVTQRLNNQLSVDSSGSVTAPGLNHHHHRHTVLEPPGASLMSRHPPHYSEASSGQPHFPLHSNHSWNWSPPDANVTSETRDSESRDHEPPETREPETRDHTCDSLMLQQEDSEYNQSLPTKPYRTFYKSTPVWNWYSETSKKGGNRKLETPPAHVYFVTWVMRTCVPIFTKNFNFISPMFVFFRPRSNVCFWDVSWGKIFSFSSSLYLGSIFRPDFFFRRKEQDFVFIFTREDWLIRDNNN